MEKGLKFLLNKLNIFHTLTCLRTEDCVLFFVCSFSFHNRRFFSHPVILSSVSLTKRFAPCTFVFSSFKRREMSIKNKSHIHSRFDSLRKCFPLFLTHEAHPLKHPTSTQSANFHIVHNIFEFGHPLYKITAEIRLC